MHNEQVDKNLEVQDDGCNKGDKGPYSYHNVCPKIGRGIWGHELAIGVGSHGGEVAEEDWVDYWG
jgi:hypothetical protein